MSKRKRGNNSENRPPVPSISKVDPAQADQTARRRNLFLALGFIGLLATTLALLFVFMFPGSGGATGQGTARCVIETSMGDISIELYGDQAPITVKNFLDYVDAKHYDGTIFHRVISDFMIQGGGMDAQMRERSTKNPIKNEAGNGIKNERGTLAMARTGNPDSATSQFFINVKYNDFLDRANAEDRVGYAVFGKVTDGMDVVDRIRVVRTGNRQGQSDVPEENVFIKSIRRIN